MLVKKLLCFSVKLTEENRPMNVTFYDLMGNFEYGDLEAPFTKLYGNDYTKNSVKLESVFEALKDEDEEVKEWLNSAINPSMFVRYSNAEIICHFLWEITSLRYNRIEVSKGLENEENRTIESLMEELQDIEEDRESQDLLKEILKYEIESTSSEDDR